MDEEAEKKNVEAPKTYPSRERSKPERYGQQHPPHPLLQKAISSQAKDKAALAKMAEALRKQEMEDKEEMENLDRKRKERKEILEHISTLLEEKSTMDQQQQQGAAEGGAPPPTSLEGAEGGEPSPISPEEEPLATSPEGGVPPPTSAEGKVQFEPQGGAISPLLHVGTSTPQHHELGPGARPRTNVKVQFSPSGETIDSAEEHFTGFQLYNLPMSTVKKTPAISSLLQHHPSRENGRPPAVVPHSHPLAGQQQLLRSPVHVVHSQSMPRQANPAYSQPLLGPTPSSRAPPAGNQVPPSQLSSNPSHQSLSHPGDQLSSSHQGAPVPPPSQQPVYSSTMAPANPVLSEPPLYGVPKPTIPNFTEDSERAFANLKLALDNLLDPYIQLSEKYKYHVLLEHLKLPEAQMIAQSCRHHAEPYTATMQALQLQYGQPHQLAQSEIAAMLTAPDIRPSDSQAFQTFSLQVHLLVSMLESLEGPDGYELNCCSHVDRLLSKLPKYLRDGFIEFLHMQGKLTVAKLNPYNLKDLAGWLHSKAQQQRLSNRLVQRYQSEQPNPRPAKPTKTTVYHGSESDAQPIPSYQSSPKPGAKVYCLFCRSQDHYINSCPKMESQTKDELRSWITESNRCWRCGRTSHATADCTLKKPCPDCGELHLRVLHPVANQEPSSEPSCSSSTVYFSHLNSPDHVLLKVVPVLLWNNDISLSTYAVLDDGSARSMILPAAVQHLQLKGKAEILALHTIKPDLTQIAGKSVQFEISPLLKPTVRYPIHRAFTAEEINLPDQTYAVQPLKQHYPHLRDIPLQTFRCAQPLVLLGSDNSHLIGPMEPMRRGTQGGPIAVRTALGWTLQGHEGLPEPNSPTPHVQMPPPVRLASSVTASPALPVPLRPSLLQYPVQVLIATTDLSTKCAADPPSKLPPLQSHLHCPMGRPRRRHRSSARVRSARCPPRPPRKPR